MNKTELKEKFKSIIEKEASEKTFLGGVFLAHSDLDKVAENILKELDTLSPSLRWVNVYEDDKGKFISDAYYDSFKEAFEGRDELGPYLGTVGIYGELPDMVNISEANRSRLDESTKPKPEPDAEDFQDWLTPKIDAILKLHDTFLETFPDREDVNDTDLKLAIRAGITDLVRELKFNQAILTKTEASDAVEFAEWVSYMEIWQEGERWLNNEAVFAQNTQELYQLFKDNPQTTEAKTSGNSVEQFITMQVHSSFRKEGYPTYVPMMLFNEETAQKNHGQTLLRLNARGGLSPAEMMANIERRRFKPMDEREAMDKVLQHMEELTDIKRSHLLNKEQNVQVSDTTGDAMKN
jgi:hypothetical protein